MTVLKRSAIALSLLGLAGLALTMGGLSRWRGLTDELVQNLQAARVAPTLIRYDVRQLDGLPAPVKRYFHAALMDGAPIIAGVTVSHTGRFNMSESDAQWKPFSSSQEVVTQRPGFVWNGRIQAFPGLDVHVHDAYVAGEGVLHPAVLGLFSITNLRDTGALAHDELMRFLAEAPWYPTALLPGPNLHWQPVDDQSAEATLTDGPQTVTLRFHFGADGLIESVRSEARGRSIGGVMTPAPWEGRWFDYERYDGMRVPTRGEAAWVLPQGRHPYWRGTIDVLRYEFVAATR